MALFFTAAFDPTNAGTGALDPTKLVDEAEVVRAVFIRSTANGLTVGFADTELASANDGFPHANLPDGRLVLPASTELWARANAGGASSRCVVVLVTALTEDD
jgi:hypothetical protein